MIKLGRIHFYFCFCWIIVGSVECSEKYPQNTHTQAHCLEPSPYITCCLQGEMLFDQLVSLFVEEFVRHGSQTASTHTTWFFQKGSAYLSPIPFLSEDERMIAMILTLRHLWTHSITRPYYQHVVIPAVLVHRIKDPISKNEFWVGVIRQLKKGESIFPTHSHKTNTASNSEKESAEGNEATTRSSSRSDRFEEPARLSDRMVLRGLRR